MPTRPSQQLYVSATSLSLEVVHLGAVDLNQRGQKVEIVILITCFCEETQTCNPLLYSACGYSNWLRNFKLEDCTQHSPRRLMKTYVEDYLKEN